MRNFILALIGAAALALSLSATPVEARHGYGMHRHHGHHYGWRHHRGHHYGWRHHHRHHRY
jgi:Spy/CpxP family protein refolding chaperone